MSDNTRGSLVHCLWSDQLRAGYIFDAVWAKSEPLDSDLWSWVRGLTSLFFGGVAGDIVPLSSSLH